MLTNKQTNAAENITS